MLNSYVNVLWCCQSGEESGRATESVVTSLHGCVKGCQFVFARSEECCVISILAPNCSPALAERDLLQDVIPCYSRFRLFFFFSTHFMLLDSYFLLGRLCADSYSCHQGSAALLFFLFACEGCSHFHFCRLWLAELGSIMASPDVPGKSALSVCSRVV